ncbi:exopolygalacturonase-like [Aristolochia californica]|uniref:exopolygalacturonase-like n=1 Tax=Aristolochia californica TaxID=171875 RepID=UPI0035DF254E
MARSPSGIINSCVCFGEETKVARFWEWRNTVLPSFEMGSRSVLCTVCVLFLFQWITEADAFDLKVFNVKNFGAIPGGKTDCSKALMNAWKAACEWEGTSRVIIPEGTFLVGPVVLKGPCKSPMVLQVKGMVKAPDLNKFTSDGWIDFQYIDGLMITGGGKFDGQGARAWPHNKCSNGQKCQPLPTSLRFSFVTNATVRGISSIDSKFFHMMIFASKNVKLQALKISAPADSPNTDGIHIALSSDIRISRSVIGTGDDCVSIGPGNSNIYISNVFCGPGHGISVGSLGRDPNEGDVVGLTVKNCTFTNTDNGIRIKTWPSSPAHSSATNFTFEDLVMKNVRNPIVIDQQYCPYSSCDLKSPSRVKISNVVFENIRGSSASKVAVNLLCSKGVPCQNVKLSDIDLDYFGREGDSSVSTCSNVEGISSGYQVPPSCI